MNAKAISVSPQIFEYDDYRVFLRDMYDYLKATRPQFSYRYFAARAGFQSPNFLKLVIEGERNLSEDSIAKFASALKLGKEETAFFQNLVGFNQASESVEKSECAKKLMRSNSLRRLHPLRQAAYDYYACWYYIPIRELVKLEHFREDPEWIASRLQPSIKPHEAAQALQALEALGLIKRDENGKLKQTHESLTTDDEVASSQIANYHREMMSYAAGSISSVDRSEREISAACIPVSETAMKKIKSRIQEFRDEILAIASEDVGCDRIYQLNFQLFPLSKKEDPV